MRIIVGASFFIILIVTSVGRSEESMAFPEEELARESVVPVFDVPNSVRNRNIVVSGKIEIGGFLGSVTDEAIYNQTQVGFVGTYHFNESHGINMSFSNMAGGIGTYAKSLGASEVGLDFSKTFGPKNYFLANYQFTGFYGKLSILKNLVVNTHIYGLLGGGTVLYEGASFMALDFGLGQRFYILKSIAIRFDLKFVRYTGPNSITKSKSQLRSGELKITDYETTNFMTTHLTGGLVFLF